MARSDFEKTYIWYKAVEDSYLRLFHKPSSEHLLKSSVGAARIVSPNSSQHLILPTVVVWGKGDAVLLNPDKTKVCVSDMFKGLDLRVEHFHCFSDHGEGGHYHYDVTPDEVQYSGFCNLAEKI
ncbi:unnamed protein product [Porites lobata]|uniref:DUF1907 domain-containing protein n=1 Tax=Porites lobata TaxID=104759 RepID=A0ABN8NWM3_9CNID|nr:unnamed protein product [Porites lobata]